MKKEIILLIISTLFISGYGIENKYISIQEKRITNKEISRIYNNLPLWIINPTNTKTGITAIGVAKKLKYRTMRDLRRIAFNDGLVNLAKNISVHINSELTKNLEYKSGNKKGFLQKSIKIKTKEIVRDINIIGAEQIDSYFSENGEFYILIQIPYAIIDEEINKRKK